MNATALPTWLPADPRQRRWLAVAFLVLLCAVLIAAIAVPAVLLHRHYDDNIFKLERQLRTQTTFNALRPRLTEKLELLKARDVRKLFLKGTSSALALAELSENVRVTIEASGGRVIQSSSVQGNVPKEEGAYRQVATGFSLNASNVNLRRLLYALETKEPYLFIDTVVVQPSIGSGFRPGQGVVEPDMFVQLEVRGFALRAPSEVTPAASPPAAAGSTSTPNMANVRGPAAVARGSAT